MRPALSRVAAKIGREQVEAAIEKHGGAIARMVDELGVRRREVYSLVYVHGLEGAVARARRRRREPPEWLARTRAALVEKIR